MECTLFVVVCLFVFLQLSCVLKHSVFFFNLFRFFSFFFLFFLFFCFCFLYLLFYFMNSTFFLSYSSCGSGGVNDCFSVCHACWCSCYKFYSHVLQACHHIYHNSTCRDTSLEDLSVTQRLVFSLLKLWIGVYKVTDRWFLVCSLRRTKKQEARVSFG